MIRIRFHGRGGHGVKTAARIVGTAAFLDGYQVQDSPIYGAERRGAAVAAYTRIDKAPILERGIIESPDLIVIADETLLNDRLAGTLLGQETASAVFINANNQADFAEKFGIIPALLTLDLTSITRDAIGRASALSSGLGAGAARLTGKISIESLIEAVRNELGELDAAHDLIDKNVQIAKDVFNRLPAVEFAPHNGMTNAAMHVVEYDAPIVGTSSIVAPGNAQQRSTGNWRIERPVIDTDVCTKCGLCILGCPDGAISYNEHGYPAIDYDHCKGCMLCAHMCPLHGIGREREVRAW